MDKKIIQQEYNESVLDFPNDGLDLNVWMKTDDGKTYTLRPECREKVITIIDQMVKKFKIPQCQVNITGSITSNSYTSDSDIDLHFNSPKVKEDKVDDLTKTLRTEFEKFKESHAESDWHLGEHPIEVYFQGNVFQDMMSVGCYSVLDDTWIVGPELTNKDFNPYSEYYDDDMKYVNNLIGGTRDVILRVYEKALVFGKLNKKEQEESKLMKDLEDSAKLFTEIRETRSSFSAPKSKEDALKKRKDRKWKIADSAFKLLDKFGYLAILREYTKCFEDKVSIQEAVERIVKVVRDNLGPDNKKLHEDDIQTQKQKFKIWIDDVRQVPNGYIWIKSVNDFIAFIEENGINSIDVIDLDHDAGDYQKDGGDYIRCLDWLEFIGAKDLRIRLHTDNPVGRQNMQRIIKKNGWTEIYDVLDESQEGFGGNCGIYALKQAKKYLKQGHIVQIVFCTNIPFDQKDELLNGDGMLYHVAIILDNDKKQMYDASGKIDVKYIKGFCKDEYRDPEPEIWALEYRASDDEEDKYIEKLIRNCTAFDESEQLDEGAKEVVASLALALACAIPGQVDGATTKAAKNMTNMSTEQLEKKTQEFESKVSALDLRARYGKYNVFQAINIFALTLFGEGRGEIDNGGIYLIADTIINRTYNGLFDIPGICVGRAEGRAFQYSFWNNHKDALQKISNGNTIVPDEIGNPIEYKAWNKCIEIAIDVLCGKYKVTNEGINSYYVTSMKNPPSWTKQLKNVVVKGHHTFGYYWYNDPQNTDMMTMLPRRGGGERQIAKNTALPRKQYTIRRGDNLWNIAKANGTTARAIASKNNIPLNGVLKIGQKIII